MICELHLQRLNNGRNERFICKACVENTKPQGPLKWPFPDTGVCIVNVSNSKGEKSFNGVQFLALNKFEGFFNFSIKK